MLADWSTYVTDKEYVMFENLIFHGASKFQEFDAKSVILRKKVCKKYLYFLKIEKNIFLGWRILYKHRKLYWNQSFCQRKTQNLLKSRLWQFHSRFQLDFFSQHQTIIQSQNISISERRRLLLSFKCNIFFKIFDFNFTIFFWIFFYV